MAQTKNTRLIYNDAKNLAIYNSLQPEDFKEFMMALLTYQPGDEMADYFTNPYMYTLFLTFKDKIDYNEEKWQKQAEINKENGKKGGRPRKNSDLQPNTQFEAEISPIEPVIEEEPQVVPPVTQEASEEPQNGQEMDAVILSDSDIYDERALAIYDANEGAFHTLFLKTREHPDPSARKEAQQEIRNIFLGYKYKDKNDLDNIFNQVKQLTNDWYDTVYLQREAV